MDGPMSSLKGRLASSWHAASIEALWAADWLARKLSLPQRARAAIRRAALERALDLPIDRQEEA